MSATTPANHEGHRHTPPVGAHDNKLTFLLYHFSRVPRYYEIKKSWPLWAIVVPSAVALASVMMLLSVVIYHQHQRQEEQARPPLLLKELTESNFQLKKELQEQQALNTELQDRLANEPAPQVATAGPAPAPGQVESKESGKIDNRVSLQTLSLFRPIQGQADESTIPAFSIEDPEVVMANKSQMNFRFNIVNLSKDGQKLSGHIFVVLKDNSSLHFFPATAFNDEDMQISFNRGESFSTTKFRPVEASFARPARSGKLLFKVLIFSRTGNLIHKQVFTQDVKI